MRGTRATTGLLVAIAASMTFGTSGAFIKPLLEAGWSPAAAVTARALIGGILLAPVALISLRGRWSALWRGRWRVLGMGLVGVAACQLFYFASLQRINVSTAILVEYLAPIALVGVVWARTRRVPRAVVLAGSVVAIGGLLLVVGPSAFSGGDPLGLVFALLAMAGCAAYFVLAARPSDGLPPVALASAGLLLGGSVLALVGATGLLPFTATTAPVVLMGATVPFFVPLIVVGILATAVAYVASITASEMLGSRLASFLGLLEVVFATLYAWLLLGETLTVVQLGGGALILAGIALVRSDRSADALPEEIVATMPIPVVAGQVDVLDEERIVEELMRTEGLPDGELVALTPDDLATAALPLPVIAPRAVGDTAPVRQNGSDGLPGEPSPRDAGLPAR